jgi:hypothetical protein
MHLPVLHPSGELLWLFTAKSFSSVVLIEKLFISCSHVSAALNKAETQKHPLAAASLAHLAHTPKTGLALLLTLLQLPFYNRAVNLVWCGLSTGLLLSVGLLAAIMFGQGKGAVDPEVMTWVSTATVLNFERAFHVDPAFILCVTIFHCELCT